MNTSRATKVKYIVIHCTAGYANAKAVQSYFTRSKSQGGRGWHTGGYHRIIEEDGTIEKMYGFETVTNGVAGFNTSCVHISYVGGIEKGNVNKAKDSRTNAQKASIEKCIVEAISWLKDNGKDVTKDLIVLGHRDFSNDNNRNGTIESWERIKECPSFEVISEYNHIYGATQKPVILPKNR